MFTLCQRLCQLVFSPVRQMWPLFLEQGVLNPRLLTFGAGSFFVFSCALGLQPLQASSNTPPSPAVTTKIVTRHGQMTLGRAKFPGSCRGSRAGKRKPPKALFTGRPQTSTDGWGLSTRSSLPQGNALNPKLLLFFFFFVYVLLNAFCLQTVHKHFY